MCTNTRIRITATYWPPLIPSFSRLRNAQENDMRVEPRRSRLQRFSSANSIREGNSSRFLQCSMSVKSSGQKNEAYASTSAANALTFASQKALSASFQSVFKALLRRPPPSRSEFGLSAWIFFIAAWIASSFSLAKISQAERSPTNVTIALRSMLLMAFEFDDDAAVVDDDAAVVDGNAEVNAGPGPATLRRPAR